MEKRNRPQCYDCKHRRELDWSAHSCCQNKEAKVTGHTHGINKGWFAWPINFDPVWLTSCDGFEDKAGAA